MSKYFNPYFHFFQTFKIKQNTIFCNYIDRDDYFTNKLIAKVFFQKGYYTVLKKIKCSAILKNAWNIWPKKLIVIN
jgi:hypothetical protein